MRITPTVGRVVWFREIGTESENGQPMAATVAYVHGDGDIVNLSVVDPNGVQFSCGNVPLVQDGADKPSSGYYCEWMPYQVGQAKAHATEAAAA